MPTEGLMWEASGKKGSVESKGENRWRRYGVEFDWVRIGYCNGSIMAVAATPYPFFSFGLVQKEKSTLSKHTTIDHTATLFTRVRWPFKTTMFSITCQCCEVWSAAAMRFLPTYPESESPYFGCYNYNYYCHYYWYTITESY